MMDDTDAGKIIGMLGGASVLVAPGGGGGHGDHTDDTVSHVDHTDTV